MNIVILILTFFSLYKHFNLHYIPNKMISLLVAIVITYLVLIPVTWFTWFVFAITFMLEFPNVMLEGLFPEH
ncbi:hypothetical protein KJ765_05040 [Candidatus Micrarchaeota archaeon]|nr:hypothetical protein [Candidatus Micrarchaeota archaeon]